MKISNFLPDWFLESNRWKHFVGGFVLGMLLTVLSALGCAGVLLILIIFYIFNKNYFAI